MYIFFFYVLLHLVRFRFPRNRHMICYRQYVFKPSPQIDIEFALKAVV